MKPSRFLAASAALLALCASPAFAHDDAYLATQKAPNGGQLRMAGPYHYELVAGDSASTNAAGRLLVYVTDHAGAPMPTQGAQGVAHVLAGKERASVPLAPDGANRMKGAGAYPWTSDAKVVVSITMPGAKPEQARFAAEPTAAASANPAAGHAH
ncbi:MAG: hypothetical protein ROZ64_06580 [Burkholderiaceae bacterium]|jgi:hypothetical protein|nr:hypothetical protein [Burkholderiaceae bacterium]